MFSSKTNVLVGHSYGTSVIARVNQALSSSVAIAGVVFIGTADHMQAGGHPIFLLPLPVLRCIEPIISAQFVKIAFSPRTSAEIRLKALSVNIKNDMRICQYFYRQYVWASDDDWRKLVCPTLIIQGADDAITPLVKAQSLHNRLLRWNPDSRHLFVAISGGGHLVMQEKSAEVLRLVASFLTEVLKDRR
jgi:pimeloyl-ACP methyl ester carboxylesterase